MQLWLTDLSRVRALLEPGRGPVVLAKGASALSYERCVHGIGAISLVA